MAGDLKDFVIGGLAIGAGFLVNLIPGGQIPAKFLWAYGAERIQQGIFGDGLGDAPAAVAARIAGVKVNARSTQASIPVVYGITRVGLREMDVRVISSADSATPSANPALLFTGADNNDVLAKVGALALGSNNGTGIQAVDNIRMYDDGVDVITNPVAFSVAPSSTGVAFPYDSKLKYTLEDGDDSQTANSLVRNSLGWGTDMKGAGVAYGAFYMFFDTDVWQGVPQITAEITGNRVYDPRTEAYINFSAVKTAASSDNPALCILDYLTSKRYGGGVPYEARDGGDGDDFIHEQSFIDAANYCDVLVPIPETEATEKRFRINAAIDTSRRVGANLASMLATCRGELVWQGGTYRLVINQVTTAETFELTEDNIVGSLNWRRQGTLVPNLIEATFPDERDGHFNPASVVWPLTGDKTFLNEDNGVENRAEVGLPFTTGYYQALRTIMVRLRESRNDVFVNLTATQEAYKLQVGEVVKITHEGPGWDREEFLVRQVALSSDGLVSLALQQYTVAAYALDTLDTQPSAPTTNLPDTSSIAVPTSVAVTSDTTTALDTQDGQAVPRIKLTWTPPSDDPFLAHFNIRFKKTVEDTDFTAVSDANREDTSAFIWPVSNAVAYTVEVRSVNVVGVASAWVSVSITVVTLPAVRLSLVRAFSGVPGADQATVLWTRNSSTHEVWAYVKTLPLPVDDDDDPWPNDTVLPTSILAVGTDSIVVSEPAVGSVTFIQLEPRAASGRPGKVVRVTVDPLAIAVEIETPTWGIITESEGATDGTFTVKLYDPDAVMDDVYWRSKSGAAAWGTYAVQDATPTHLDSYTRTVTMVERHPSFVEFRGRYTVNGVEHTTVIKSSGLDLGIVPNITVALATDEVGALSANVQGDVDTASIKILASKAGQPTDANTRLEASQNGRMFTAANIGTVTLDVGETGYVTAFGYGEAAGAGIESTASAKVLHKRPVVVVPTIEDESQVEDGTDGTFTVKVLDPQGLATNLYYRTKSGTAAWSAWIEKTDAPANATSYDEDVALVEGHQSFVQFQLWYDIGTKSFKIPVTSGGFDIGRIAGGSFVPSVDVDARTASGSAQGDTDTTGWKIVGQTSGVVSDSTVNSASTTSGRALTPAQVGTLASSLTVGQTVYFGAKAIGPDGNGPLLLHQMAVGKIAPVLSVSTESESGSTGTFAVALSDPSGIATALDYRIKSGAAAWGGWASKDSSPTPGENANYTQDVSLAEGHLSFIAFRLTYVLLGNTQYRHVVSGGFDIGKIATGGFTPVVNTDEGKAYASAQGDIDTTGWKLKAKTSSVSTSEIDAVTTVTQRSPTHIELLSGLTTGDTVYFGARAIGDTNGPYLYHQITIEGATPRIRVETESESSTTGTFAVRLSDPDGAASKLESRTKSGDGAWSAYGDPDTSLADDDTYSKTVTLVEGHLSFVDVRMTYALRGVTQYAHLSSAGFDKGTIPNISVSLTTDGTGILSANVQGDVDTASIRILGSTSGQPSDGDTRAATAKDGRMFTTADIGTLATLAVGETGYVTAFGYGSTGGGGKESTASVKVRRVRPDIITPRLEDESQTETTTTGTHTVKVLDPQGLATDLYYRTKSGAGAWTVWTLKTATPTNATSYTETVTQVEGHLSFVQFQLSYSIGTSVFKIPVTSGGFDKGKVPNISVTATIDAAGILSANVQGDSDTNAIKIRGSTSSQPTDIATRAVTAIDKRMSTTADIGTLATLAVGETGYVTAFAYSVAGGGGLESTESIKVRKVRSDLITPKLEEVSQAESGSTGTFTVKVLDPAGMATDLYYRTKSGAADWSAWTLKTATPADATSYAETVALIENHQSFVQFQLWYDVDGSTPLKIPISSGGFDFGTIPNISVSLTTDETGILSANVQGDVDTASIRILGSTSGQPSDSDTRAATAKNGRMFTTADIGTLATLTVGQTGYVTAFGYGATSGGVPESTTSVKLRYIRPGEFKPEVQVREVRTDETSVVTIDIVDTFLRVTDIEYKKRDGADGGAALSGSWLTAWSDTTGTAGTHVALQREINIPVVDGTEGELQWQVKYTDVNGTEQTFGDSLKVVNLAGTTRKIVIPFSSLVMDHLNEWVSPYLPYELKFASGYAYGSDSGYAVNYGTVTLPPGVTITKMSQTAYRRITDDGMVSNFFSYPFDGTIHTGHGTVTHDTTGWQTKEVSLNVVVAEDRLYTFRIQMIPDWDGGITNTGLDVRFAAMTLEYTRPAYSYSY